MVVYQGTHGVVDYFRPAAHGHLVGRARRHWSLFELVVADLGSGRRWPYAGMMA
jgi:hypothetical protein